MRYCFAVLSLVAGSVPRLQQRLGNAAHSGTGLPVQSETHNRLSNISSLQDTLRSTSMLAQLGAPGPVQLRRPLHPPDRDSLFHLLHEANSGLNDPVRTVVRDSSSWEDWWRRVTANHRQAVPLPPVDFRREMVILVGLGRQRSTGYDVTVVSARHVGATLQLRVQVSLLGLGPCMAGMAVTSPVDIIRIPRSGAVVTFIDESFQQDCRQ